MKYRLLCTSLLLAVTSVSSFALPASTSDNPLKLMAASAILIEQQTGKVLFALHPDLPIPPASLTKLMTLHLALQAIVSGKLSLNKEIVPQSNAWAINMPPDSSLMFLGPDQRLTVSELLKGLIVDSGNDAAVEVADLVAGSVANFAVMMNREAAGLGFPTMHFVGPSGISAANVITAREYASFCRLFINLHPQALSDLLSIKEFTYPTSANVTGGSNQHPITQFNRNLLLWEYPGTDGLKTGYIDESGYNMAATAKRDGMRLIAVVLGIRAGTASKSMRERAKECEELLDYGFNNFTTVRPTLPDIQSVRVWKGKAKTVQIAPSQEVVVVVHKELAGILTAHVDQTKQLLAPVRHGQKLGTLSFTAGNTEVASFPLVAQSSVARGGVFRRAVDSIQLFFRRLFGRPLPQ